MRQLVVQVLHPLLPHLVLLLDIVLHVVRLVFDFLNDLLLLGNTQLLFFDEAVLYSLQLAADRVQVVVVVLDTVLAFLIDPALGLVHPCVVRLPLLSEYLCFFIHLTLQVVAELLELVLELLLKLVDHVVDMVHGRNGELLVLSDLLVSVLDLLLHLALVLNTCVLEDFERGTHVLHLGLESW